MRAVYRELRSVALQLDSVLLTTVQQERLLGAHASLRAALLPEPFSAESLALTASQSSSWGDLVYLGTARALRVRTPNEQLMKHGLFILRDLHTLHHKASSTASFVREMEAPSAQGSLVDIAGHSALGAVIDGSMGPNDIQVRIESTMDGLVQRTLDMDKIAEETQMQAEDGTVPPRHERLLRSVNHTLFLEGGMQLTALPPSPGDCILHTALERHSGSSLCLAWTLAALIARCQETSLPSPALLALPDLPLGWKFAAPGLVQSPAQSHRLHSKVPGPLQEPDTLSEEQGGGGSQSSTPWVAPSRNFVQRVLVHTVDSEGQHRLVDPNRVPPN